MNTGRGITRGQVMLAALSVVVYATLIALASPNAEPAQVPDAVADAASYAAGKQAARDELLEEIALAYRQGTRDAMKVASNRGSCQ